MNFLSLYSLVASNDQGGIIPSTKISERLSMNKTKKKYQARDSTAPGYKITPQLSKKLGLEKEDSSELKGYNNKVTVDIESLKRYSRNSIMLQSLTGYVAEEDSPSKKVSEHFESTGLALVLKRLKDQNQ